MLEFRVRTISSRDNPIVRDYRSLASEPDASAARLLLDGAHLVREAHAVRMEFESVAVAASRLAGHTEEGELARALDAEGVSVVTVIDEVFAAMSPVRTPSGIIAIAERTPVDASAIWNTPDGFTLVAVDVQDPGNIGALVRTAEAGGVTGVVVSGASANPFSWKALRGSMGSSIRLPVARAPEVGIIVDWIQAAGTRAIASIARGGRAPDEINWAGPIALFIGGEGPGLPEAVVERCDDQVTIPMAPSVESLNVAVAAGVLIYAARRHRPQPSESIKINQ
jgi:TrmH family RNA methyltransferase